jgi:hypothetical protein
LSKKLGGSRNDDAEQKKSQPKLLFRIFGHSFPSSMAQILLSDFLPEERFSRWGDLLACSIWTVPLCVIFCLSSTNNNWLGRMKPVEMFQLRSSDDPDRFFEKGRRTV